MVNPAWASWARGTSAAMSARSKLLAASLTAVLLVGGATACGDEGEGGDMGDMEMEEED